MASVIAYVSSHLPAICGFVWAIGNELTAFSPSLKANSLVQVVLGWFKSESGQ